jgi:2-dehydropantoate 2-reductase
VAGRSDAVRARLSAAEPSMSRFIIVGAGAIGGLVGALLARSGAETLLVARPAQARAIAEAGLRVRTPDTDERIPVPVTDRPLDALTLARNDMVLLCVKSQDTEHAVRALAGAAPPGTPVACLQNGLHNELVALRRFEHVLGVNVMLPATHLEPGVVVAHSAPVPGILDVGRTPQGTDEHGGRLARALTAAGFSSAVLGDVQRWKRTKLLVNLGNAVETLCGSHAAAPRLLELVRREGHAALTAAGMDTVPDQEYATRRAGLIAPRPVSGAPRAGSSSWQSLARGAQSVETDYLNGEVVLLGRLHGTRVDANALVMRLMRELVREGRPPGALSEETILAQLAADPRRD